MMTISEKIMCPIMIFVLILFCVSPLRADWNEEVQKINFLLEQVGQVDGYFIRNGSDHSPQSAEDHLKMKMENAMNSWFAPDKDKWTAEMFIDKIASKSSFSGKPYQIRFKSEQIVNAGEWLHERLKEFNTKEQRGR